MSYRGELELTQTARQHQKGNTRREEFRRKPKELLDSLPEVRAFWQGTIKPHILAHPNRVTIVASAGESGVSKGVGLGQIAAEMLGDDELANHLADKGKRLKGHYASTASGLKETSRRGMTHSPWGHFTNPEWNNYSNLMLHSVALSKIRFPREEPNATHVLFLELLMNPQLGGAVIEAFGMDPDFFLLVVKTKPDIQARAYRQRKALWTPGVDPNTILHAHATVVDMPADRVLQTMGNADAIKLVNSKNNTLIKNNFDANLLRVSAAIEPFEPEDLNQFGDYEMQTDPRRPELLAAQYQYLLELWHVLQFIQVDPSFLQSTIHYYAQLLENMSLNFADVLDKPIGKTYKKPSQLFKK